MPENRITIPRELQRNIAIRIDREAAAFVTGYCSYALLIIPVQGLSHSQEHFLLSFAGGAVGISSLP